MKLFTLLFLVFFTISSLPERSDAKRSRKKSTISKLKIKKKRKKRKSKWNYGLSLQHYMGFRDDIDGVSSIIPSFRYQFNKKHQLSVIQPITKLYNIPIDDREVFLEDTLIFHFYTMYKKKKSLKVRLRSGLTLPLSPFSSEQGVTTKASLMLVPDYYLTKKLFISYRPYLRYAFNQYSSTISGNPLRQWSLGHMAVLNYQFTSRIYANLFAETAHHQNEKHAQASSSPPPNGSYSYDLSLGYQATRALALTGGVMHSDQFIKDGRFETLLFDRDVTRFYFSTNFSF